MEHFTNEYRINYYTNNNLEENILEENNFSNIPCFDNFFILNEQSEHSSNYMKDIKKFFSNYKKYKILVIFGDNLNKNDYLCLAKARNLGENKRILLKLNEHRHWGNIKHVNINDIAFNQKNNKLIWRGSTLTGPKKNRSIFVKNIDSFKNVNFDFKHSIKNDKNSLTLNNQLKSKFLLSIEGNDVSSGLKWMLYSNSCVLMCKPTCCSWAMEDHLIPYYHYVPINDDFTDLEKQYEWCLQNINKCEEIALNGKRYIEQFLNVENERKITGSVIEHYLKIMKFK
jgi:hypothetical protein